MSVEEFLDLARESGVPSLKGRRVAARRLGSSADMCELLIGLVLEEHKTCTASLLQQLQEEGGMLRPGRA